MSKPPVCYCSHFALAFRSRSMVLLIYSPQPPTVHIPSELIPSILQHVTPPCSFPSLPHCCLYRRSQMGHSGNCQYCCDFCSFTQRALVCRTCAPSPAKPCFIPCQPSHGWMRSFLQLCSTLQQFCSSSRLVLNLHYRHKQRDAADEP